MIDIIPPIPIIADGLAPFTEYDQAKNKAAGINHSTTNRMVFTRYLSSFFIVNLLFM